MLENIVGTTGVLLHTNNAIEIIIFQLEMMRYTVIGRIIMKMYVMKMNAECKIDFGLF